MYGKLKSLINKFKQVIIRKKYGWFGDFVHWKEAEQLSKGYDDELIVSKVKDALLKVKSGEAIYERDSVLFDKKQYSWPLLSSLMKIALISGNRLSVLDFGGSLGTTYYQNLDFLSNIKDFKWHIVEQKGFVDVGKELFEDAKLKFYYTITESINASFPEVILLSSVLQYIQNYQSVLDEVLSLGSKYIILDRTAFTDGDQDLITIQIVPPEIYSASYPSYFFSYQRFMEKVSVDFEVELEFDSYCDVGYLHNSRNNVFWKGIVLKRKLS